MEKSKAKKGLPVFIGVAAVWMGTHFGPGVASGTQLNQYYVRFGLPGIFVTIIAMGFLGYALYCSMEFSRIYKAYDYQSWVVKLFGNKYVVILFDISFLVTILTAASGSMNAVAVLLEDNFGINYWLGVAIIIVCAMLLCAYGAKLVRAASSYMMFIVVGILLVIMVLLAVNGDGDLSGSIANQAQNLSDAGSGSWLGALWSAIIYGSFQATIVANIASVAEDIPNRRESKKAAITGFLANTILLIVLCMMLFSYTNVYDITSEDLPFYSLLHQMSCKAVTETVWSCFLWKFSIGYCPSHHLLQCTDCQVIPSKFIRKQDSTGTPFFKPVLCKDIQTPFRKNCIAVHPVLRIPDMNLHI